MIVVPPSAKPVALPVAAKSAPVAPAAPAPASGIRLAAANAIRGVGQGVDLGAQDMGAVADQVALRPVEASYALGKLIGKGMEKIPFTKKYAGMAATVGGFLALIATQSVTGIAKAPGDFAHDITSSVADAIEGKTTPKRGFGFAGVIGAAGGQEVVADQQDALLAATTQR